MHDESLQAGGARRGRDWASVLIPRLAVATILGRHARRTAAGRLKSHLGHARTAVSRRARNDSRSA